METKRLIKNHKHISRDEEWAEAAELRVEIQNRTLCHMIKSAEIVTRLWLGGLLVAKTIKSYLFISAGNHKASDAPKVGMSVN